jgi:hypothetical protein
MFSIGMVCGPVWMPLQIRVQIAKAAVAAQYVRRALFDCVVFAFPYDIAGAPVNDRAPSGIAIRAGVVG